jgi:hypothetical protein
LGGGVEAPLPCPLDQPNNGPHRSQSSHQSQRYPQGNGRRQQHGRHCHNA